MRAQLAILAGLVIVVGAVFVGAGRTAGAVAMGVAGVAVLAVGVIGAMHGRA